MYIRYICICVHSFSLWSVMSLFIYMSYESILQIEVEGLRRRLKEEMNARAKAEERVLEVGAASFHYLINCVAVASRCALHHCHATVACSLFSICQPHLISYS